MYNAQPYPAFIIEVRSSRLFRMPLGMLQTLDGYLSSRSVLGTGAKQPWADMVPRSVPPGRRHTLQDG